MDTLPTDRFDDAYDIVASPGHMIVCVDVEDCPILAVDVEHQNIETLLGEVEVIGKLDERHREHELLQAALRQQLITVIRWSRDSEPQPDPSSMGGAAGLGLWLAFWNITHGHIVRATVEMMKSKGLGAVMSVCLMSDGRFACAMGTAFEDLAPLCEICDEAGLEHVEMGPDGVISPRHDPTVH